MPAIFTPSIASLEPMAAHARKVERVAKQLRERRATTPVSLRKKSVSHQVPKVNDKKHTDEKIDLTDLDQILDIDVERRVCIAEPGVTFTDLARETLKVGLAPIIVPELKTITVGGAVAGCSIESMSHTHGGFHDTCLEYEVITASGEVLYCTPDNENALVFQMIHGSFGTLGILSRLTFRLVPAKPFVHLRHETYHTLAEYQAAIWDHYKKQDVQFMDGFIHSTSHYVLCVGEFVDEAPYTNRYDWTQVFYQSTKKRKEDYLATHDYYFRYDIGVTNVHPKSFIGRLLLGKVLSSSTVLRLAEKLRWLLLSDERPMVTLDTFLPFSRLADFLDWYARECKHFPLWVVPYKRVHDYEWLAKDFWRGLSDELFIDIAIYGMKQPPDGRNYYKLLENKLAEIGGVKTLISYNYYSEAEFWRTFNRENFEAVKKRTDPDNIFRGLYEKTCKAAMGKG